MIDLYYTPRVLTLVGSSMNKDGELLKKKEVLVLANCHTHIVHFPISQQQHKLAFR